jgi:nanoRNase/pAp phosphatase (c-di-AMP/oligoRNAs hydrolase)
MHTTFAKIGKEILIEVAKSAVLVIVSSLISQSLRKSTADAASSVSQAVNYTRNKVYNLSHKEKAA